MDRMIFTALNALSVERDTRVTQAQNLANMNVPGFRRDLDNDGQSRFLDVLHGLPTRAFQAEVEQSGFSDAQGALTRSDDPFDVAIDGAGYFYIQPQTGGEVALSRRGDLRLDPEGQLHNGAGDLVLDAGLAPITLPPHQSMRIDDMGQIYITPLAGGPDQAVAMIATVVPPEELALVKSTDGHIRANGAELPAPNQGAYVRQGVLESSNVNPVQEMLASMEAQRRFELGMRMIQNAAQLDEAGARLMQPPPM